MTSYKVTPGKSTVIMGGQYGSEGKGEIAAYLANGNGDMMYSASVRTGGPNAGHTVTLEDGRKMKFRHVPCAAINEDIALYLGPGALVNTKVLDDEIYALAKLGIYNVDGKLHIDPMATIVTEEHSAIENDAGIRESIGSTREGIGAARAQKIMREGQIWSNSRNRINTAHELNRVLNSGGNVLVESSQGFGLSLEASGNYPYVTSANLTPGHILGDAGLSSRINHEVIAVMRTFPIRVHGNSGPLPHEISWETLYEESKGISPIDGERTTVTQLVRRIGRWDHIAAAKMAEYCRPDWVALTFLDYVFPELASGPLSPRIVWSKAVGYLESLEDSLRTTGISRERRKIRWVSAGPGRIVEIRDNRGKKIS